MHFLHSSHFYNIGIPITDNYPTINRLLYPCKSAQNIALYLFSKYFKEILDFIMVQYHNINIETQTKKERK